MAVDRNQLLALVTERVVASDLFAGWQVEPLALDVGDFLTKRLKSKKGAVLTSYAGQRSVRGGEAYGNREVLLDVVVLARRLEGPEGATAAITALDELLHDWQLVETREGAGGPTPIRKWLVRFASDEFLDEADKVSQHLVRFRLQLL